MIFILDNMKPYTEHAIVFYEFNVPEGLDPKDIGRALVMVSQFRLDSQVKPIILAVAERLDWWVGGAINVDQRMFESAYREHVKTNLARDFYREEMMSLIRVIKFMDPHFELTSR